jgi:hypothetical protein
LNTSETKSRECAAKSGASGKRFSSSKAAGISAASAELAPHARQGAGRAQMVIELDNADYRPWIKALAEVRRRATSEGWSYPHVQAIIISIDQYAEAARGDRDFFVNKPHSIGQNRKTDA